MEKDPNLLFALVALQLEYIDAERYKAVCADWSSNHQTPVPELLVQRNWLTAEQRSTVQRRLEQQAHSESAETPTADSRADQSDRTGLPDNRFEETLDSTGQLVGPGSPDSRFEETLDLTGERAPSNSHLEETLDSTGQLGRPDLPASRFEETLDPTGETTDAVPNLDATQDMQGEPVDHTQAYGASGAGYVPMGAMDPGQSSGERTRYTFTKMHGEGGIGRVWLAHDQHLNRQIALKEIRPDKEQSKTAWKRFVREAQITSQLEHPNIIPVYELSSRSSEQGWFYTMRFVRGETFRHAIDEFHRRRNAGKATELELRSLLTSFVAICRALGYAHSRGVLHRDLKPSNIMLGSFGEVVVLDWGLAKMVGRPEDEDMDLTSAEMVSVTEEGEIAATQQGAVLGTLPYMAPEQAAGRLDKVDSRTDIYGLGAILFAVLTGNHPHKGTTTREVRSRILKEPTPRVRHEDKSAHPVLDSICAKAMSKGRSERYAKAGDLADDIERWLADEPVSCHQDSRVAKLARWLRKHKTWAKSIAASLLAVTMISLAAVVLINSAKQAEEEAHQETAEALTAKAVALEAEQRAKQETERALAAETTALNGERKAKEIATERFQESRKTVDEMMTGVSDALRDFPGMQSLRRRFLERAADKYEQFAGENVTDVTLQLEAANSLLRLGDIYRELEQVDDARKSYRSAADRLQMLIEDEAGAGDVRLQRANAWIKQGTLASRVGEQDEAQALFERAAEELAELMAHDDPDGSYRFARAGLLVNQANLLSHSGEAEDAISMLKEAIAEFQSLTEISPDARFIDGLAMARTNLGGNLRNQGRNSEAILPLQAAAEAYRQLGHAHQDSSRYLERGATTRLNLATAFRTLGRDREEVQAYRSALADYELLAADRSDVPSYQERRALTKIDLGMVLHTVGNNREASPLLVNAIQETQQLLDTRLALFTYYEQLALGQAALGRVFADLGDERAPIFLETAIDGYDELIAADPDFAPSYRSQRAGARTALGLLYRAAGEIDAARTTISSVTEEFASLLEENPTSDSLKHALAWSYTRLGDLEWEANQRAVASECYRKAFALREQLDREPEHRYAFVRLLIGCSDPSLAAPERAEKLAAELVAEVPENARYATSLGAAYYHAGKLDEAIEQLSYVDKLSPQGGTTHEFWLVLALAKKGGEQNVNRAKNRLQSAVNRMELDVPARPTLVRLRAEAESELAPPTAAADEDGDAGS